MLEELFDESKKIDVKETRKAAEKALNKYKTLKLTVKLDHLPNVTANYSLTPPTQTNKFTSTTEDAAIKNVDYEIKRNKYMEMMMSAINRLNERERSIIIERYIANDDTFDYIVYNELGYSERVYYRFKASALQNLSLILGIEVYE